MRLPISVVVPARNAAGTIGDTLSSVLREADEDVDLVVVDDGSQDSTATVAREVADPRIRLVLGHGTGAGGARNAGLLAARHEWVALLDADDRWLPGHLSALRQTISAAPDAVACFGAAHHVDEQGRLLAVANVAARHATVEGLLRRRLQPTTSATAVRRSQVLEEGGFDVGFRAAAGVEDVDLWWRLARRGRCIVQPQPLTEYLVHERRDRRRTQQELLDLRADRERCVRRIRAEVPGRLGRLAAAQHFAILARYWLLAGQGGEARRDALRSLGFAPTANGIMVCALAAMPTAAATRLRILRRRVLARQRS